MTTLSSVFKHYWPFITSHKWGNIGMFVAWGSGGVLGGVIAPLFYKRIIDLVTGVNEPAAVAPALAETVIILVLILFLAQVLYRLADIIMTRVQSPSLKELTDYTFEKLHRHSYQFFINSFTGSLVAKCKRFVDSFETLQDIVVFEVWMNGLSLLIMCSILMWISPILGILYLGWLVLYGFMTAWFVRRKIPKDIKNAAAKTITTGALADSISNTLTIKMFATKTSEDQRFKGVTRFEQQARDVSWQFMNVQRVVQGMFVVTFQVIALVVVIWLWLHGQVTAGTIVLVQMYLMRLFDMTWNLGRNMTRIFNAITDAKEMVEILDKTEDVEDPVQPEKVQIAKGAISFKDVTFRYDRGQPVFEHFSLSIAPGEKVGLVGHSGAGKTTVTKLVLRFADVQKGEILIDGQNIAHITQDDLRRHIAYVPQEPLLFHRSLRENIAYGKPGANEQEIVEVAERARAHEFIENLPDGYETLVGERGVKLSGGERQRVAIARAMLKDAPILILDEATSSLDSLSERKIQEAFAELMKGKTALVVAHRLSTIRQLDRILVFEAGKVIEEGTHDELVQKNGTYAELWKEQAGGFIGE